VSVVHPRWLESSFKLFIKCSESLYCCICIWCVTMLVREDSVKAVWHYRELHKLTVGIIVAGSYIFISLWNVGYFGSMSWNFQGCPWGIVIFACCVALQFTYMFYLHNCLIPQCLQNLIHTLCCILKLFFLCISDKYMHLLQTSKCGISCTYNSTDVA